MSPLSAARLPRARLVDRLVAGVITAGGALILLAVGFLMLFLALECLPLLRSGRLTAGTGGASPAAALAAVEDEYREAVAVLGRDGVVRRIGKATGGAEVALEGVVPPLRQACMSADGRLLALVDAADTVQVWSYRVRTVWRGEERVLEPAARLLFASALPPGTTLVAVAGEAGSAAVLLGAPAGGVVLRGGDGEVVMLVLEAAAPAVVGALAADAGQAWLATTREVLFYDLGAVRPDGSLAPAATTLLEAEPTAATMVLGDVTLLIGDAAGTVFGFQAVSGVLPGTKRIERSAEFPGRGAVTDLAPSQRDKSFAVLRATGAEVAYLTSRDVIAKVPDVPAGAAAIGLAPRRDGLYIVTAEGDVHRWALDVRHPEASLATLFLPVHYEGFSEAELVWQSTGMTSAFEAKLSLVPLVVGTFKGALYALLFSAPVAVLGALYVSQFSPARLRAVAKPLVELMAALPSVVVGFIAALFLAPLLQRYLVGILSAMVVVPAAIVVLGLSWSAAPLTWRRRLTAGREVALVGLIAVAATALVLINQQPIERVLFHGDLASWLATYAGVTYDQRNAVVVGFALGFAVIPIIFTLAEDAFSNVPPSLVSASLALGATPWQAARTVVLPASSPGLFAAVMIGLGRAVGETMIVLMATGNTPILSLSPFNGMRTMSACIAVELPEAPYGATLYRVLILTALLLFAMTFVINTLAVMVAARLRKRFGRLAA
jgi:phosphate transport system permease protein